MKNDSFTQTRISSLGKDIFGTAKCRAMSKEQAIFCLKLFSYNLFLVKNLASFHSSIDRHFGCSHIVTIVNDAAASMGVQRSLGSTGFTSFGYRSRRGISRSYNNSFILYFLGMLTLYSIVTIPSYFQKFCYSVGIGK